jgi:uncharacterized surface anchored protein
MAIPIQQPTPTPQPTQAPIESGRLLITLKAQGTGQLLSGAVYELHRAMDGAFITYLTTDGFGEAVIDLSIGDYFLREIQAVRGFIPNPDRVNVRIAANRINELNLTSRPEPTPSPTPESTPPPVEQPTPEPGRLIITVRADGTREPLQGAGFEIRRAIDNRFIAEVTTDRFGEGYVNLPPDDYFIRQISGTHGYDFYTGRVSVKIAERAVREVSVTNRLSVLFTPPQQTNPPVEVDNGRLLITVIASDNGLSKKIAIQHKCRAIESAS